MELLIHPRLERTALAWRHISSSNLPAASRVFCPEVGKHDVAFHHASSRELRPGRLLGKLSLQGADCRIAQLHVLYRALGPQALPLD